MVTKQEYYSKIAAVVNISEADVSYIYPEYTSELEQSNPELLKSLLWQLGLDVNQLYIFQQVTQHRNMLGKIVTCHRWFGSSRLDEEWMNSGYASKEAKDKLKGSRLLDELYRSRGLTEDILAAAEEKDRWNPWKDEDGVEDD